MKTFVYIDHFKGEVQPASWEALGLGKKFGSVSAVVFGSGVDAIAKAAFEYGADEVLVADDAALLDYRVEPYASTLSALASSGTPDLILFPTTARTRELAAMIAVDLNSGVLVDVTGFEANGDQFAATRPIYEGKLLEKTVCSGKPVIATIRGRAFPKPAANAGKNGTPTKVTVKSDALTTVEGYAVAEKVVNISDAVVIVSGGRGVSNNPSLTPPAGMDEKQAEIWRAQQGFALIGELASVLGGAVGGVLLLGSCTRTQSSPTEIPGVVSGLVRSEWAIAQEKIGGIAHTIGPERFGWVEHSGAFACPGSAILKQGCFHPDAPSGPRIEWDMTAPTIIRHEAGHAIEWALGDPGWDCYEHDDPLNPN